LQFAKHDAHATINYRSAKLPTISIAKKNSNKNKTAVVWTYIFSYGKYLKFKNLLSHFLKISEFRVLQKKPSVNLRELSHAKWVQMHKLNLGEKITLSEIFFSSQNLLLL